MMKTSNRKKQCKGMYTKNNYKWQLITANDSWFVSYHKNRAYLLRQRKQQSTSVWMIVNNPFKDNNSCKRYINRFINIYFCIFLDNCHNNSKIWHNKKNIIQIFLCKPAQFLGFFRSYWHFSALDPWYQCLLSSLNMTSLALLGY